MAISARAKRMPHCLVCPRVAQYVGLIVRMQADDGFARLKTILVLVRM